MKYIFTFFLFSLGASVQAQTSDTSKIIMLSVERPTGITIKHADPSMIVEVTDPRLLKPGTIAVKQPTPDMIVPTTGTTGNKLDSKQKNGSDK
jgi:hypothetical protein